MKPVYPFRLIGMLLALVSGASATTFSWDGRNGANRNTSNTSWSGSSWVNGTGNDSVFNATGRVRIPNPPIRAATFGSAPQTLKLWVRSYDLEPSGQIAIFKELPLSKHFSRSNWVSLGFRGCSLEGRQPRLF